MRYTVPGVLVAPKPPQRQHLVRIHRHHPCAQTRGHPRALRLPGLPLRVRGPFFQQLEVEGNDRIRVRRLGRREVGSDVDFVVSEPQESEQVPWRTDLKALRAELQAMEGPEGRCNEVSLLPHLSPEIEKEDVVRHVALGHAAMEHEVGLPLVLPVNTCVAVPFGEGHLGK